MRALVVVALFGLIACSNNTVSSAEANCDPFDSDEAPIALENVLAVGRDGDDVFYVLDQPAGEEVRAFVSDDDFLFRQRVAGTGTMSSAELDSYDVNVEAEPPFSLYLEIPSSGEPRFFKHPADSRPMPGVAPLGGEELELLSEDDLEDFALRNLPPEVTVEYLGALEDGRRVLVTVPTDASSYEDFRVFFGTKDAMLEHEEVSVVRKRDGGSTTITFRLDGATATLEFPIQMVGDQFVPGPATFEHGGETLAIDLLARNPSALTQHTFVCP
jgi:hypothetical protein